MKYSLPFCVQILQSVNILFVGEDIVFPHEIYGFINNKIASAI